MKKDFTEAGYIEDVITRIALVNPNIAIKLISSGKTVIQTSGNGKLQDVIYGIYGKDVASAVLDVDFTYENMNISGVVGKPEISRSNRSNQLFFVNKRYIKDKILTGAVEKAFKGMIPIGKYGFVILNIEMEPTKVDVNVHPAKLEVRFEEESKVFKAIYHSIQDTLLKAELISAPEKEIEDKKEIVEEIKQSNALSNLFRKLGNVEKNVGVAPLGDQSNTNQQPNIIEEMYKERNNKITETDNNKDDNKEQLEQETQVINLNEIKEKYNIENNQIVEENNKAEDDYTVKEDVYVTQEENDEGTVESEQETPATSIGNILTDLARMKASLEEEKEQMKSKEINIDNNVEDNKYNDVSDKIEKLDNLNIPESFETMYEKTFGEIAPTKKVRIEEEKKKIDAYDIISEENKISVFETQEEYNAKPNYKIIGIVFKTYIIIEINNEMYIIDQHAAHERIMYDKIKKNYYSNQEKESQLLLLPDIINLTHKEMDIARDNMEIFRNAGFELEEFGENTIKLNGVPPVCYDLDTKELFLETLDEINTVARTAKQEIEERFISTVACKSAVKAHMALNNQEVEKLLDELLNLPNPFTCPHGSPTAIKMDLKDIEKKFARRK